VLNWGLIGKPQTMCQSPQERRANDQVFGTNQQEGKGGTGKQSALQEPKISHRMEKKALGISSFSTPLHSG